MTPHLIPYQGSKRRLAPRILGLLGDRRFATLHEPFAGSAAITLAAADRALAERHVIADSLVPLADLWRLCLRDPADLADRYRALWTAQLADPRAHYLQVRAAYNSAPEPIQLLYLLARCVKNAPRFAADGSFNQSADHRRKGRRPATMRTHALAIAELLRDRCDVRDGDFEATIADAAPGDLVYLDPPWLGTTVGRDKRYHAGLSQDRLIACLRGLLERGISFVLSYDGRTGARRFGAPLPADLGLQHLDFGAGPSRQATLSGRRETTYESLYLSPDLVAATGAQPRKHAPLR